MTRRFKAFVAGSFLSRMGDHLGEFGLTLMLLDRFPGRLLPALGFGMARLSVTMLLGPRLAALFDRYPTRKVLLAAITLQSFSLAGFGLVWLTPGAPMPLFWLCGAGLALGGFTYETGLTYSLLPQLGEGAALNRLAALFHSLGQMGEVIGPVVAGFVYARWGGAGIIVADVLTFIAEATGIALLVMPRLQTAAAEPVPPPPREPFWPALARCHPALPLIALAVGFAWCNGMSPHSTAFMFMLKEQLHLDPFWLGWVRTAGALSAITGAAATPWITARLGSHRTPMVLGIGLEALALVAAAWWRDSLALLLGWVVLSRFGLSVFLLSATRLRQELVPASIRGMINGRINAFFRGMALLYLCLQTLLDHLEHPFAYLAWGTAAAIAMAALSGLGAWQRLEAPRPQTAG